jgi:hypothetical protein
MGLHSGPPHGRGARQGWSADVVVGSAALRICVVDGPLTRPRRQWGPTRSPPMVSLSRKAQLQQFSWQLLEDLAFCSGRWPRLSELAAQVLVERQSAAPAMPVDPELEALLPF